MGLIETVQGRPLPKVLLGIIFLTSGLIIVLIQFTLYILIRSWNRQLYRKLNNYLTFSLHSQITFLIDFWAPSKFQLFADPDVFKKYVGKEHAFLICNHGFELEGFLLWTFSDHLGMLGNIRGMIKKTLQRAPILGWSWYLQEQVFVERNWDKDKVSLSSQLEQLTTYPHPTWLTIFPEGTRFTPEKHSLSMEKAREKNLPELKHLVLPRTKGFILGLATLRSKFPAVYDITVAVDPGCQQHASFYGLINGECINYKIAVRRYSVNDLPEDPEEVAEWLHKRFQEKDKLLDNVMKSGEFLPMKMEEPDMRQEFQTYEYLEVPRRNWSLCNVCGWASFVLGGIGYFMWIGFNSGSYVMLAVLLTILAAASYALEKTIDLSRMSKASSYGQSSK